MSPLPRRVAFVTGANGISGNAIIEHLIREPRASWDKIIVTSRKPTKIFWQDDRVQQIPIDFLKSHDELVATMKPFCSDVTHAFYTSYVHTDDFTKLPEYNIPLFENFFNALEGVAGKNLQRICLQTGGKVSDLSTLVTRSDPSSTTARILGLDLLRIGKLMLEFKESPEKTFSITTKKISCLGGKRSRQLEVTSGTTPLLGKQFSKALILEAFTTNIITRPNGIIGFTPANNGMSEAITTALYFLICRELGEVPVFPGNSYFYNCVDDCSSAKGLADLSVWAMTNEHTKDEAFNHANGDTYVWRYTWPQLGAYFGVDVSIFLDPYSPPR